jgi:hypothetical protein
MDERSLAEKELQSILGAVDAEGAEFGPAGELPAQGAAGGRRTRARADWGASVYAVQADLSPAVGLRFLAWALRHPDMLAGQSRQEQLADYLELATLRDAMADELRPAEDRQYDWEELHLTRLRPLIEREMQAQRDEIAGATAEAMLAQIQPFIDRGQVPQEVVEFLRGPDGR